MLRLRTATRDCEGAISGEAVHLLCANGTAREQLVLHFVADVER